MKRRRFLKITGIAGALGVILSGKFFLTSFEDAAERVINSELHFLNLHTGGVRDFVKAYSGTRDRRYKLTVKGYSLLGISASQSGKVHQLVSSYLLSSDFFLNKMDEARVIKYVALYDPYKKACAHPFSHLA